MFVTGTPFRPFEVRRNFDNAIKEKNLPLAWSSATSMDPVSLDRALDLTLLLGREGDGRYRKSAARFLARFISEATPALGQVKKVADALDTVGQVPDLPGMREGAERALEDLARQPANAAWSSGDAVAHTVELWEMVGEKRTIFTPACLSCGWIGADGPRLKAEEQGRRHEAGEVPPWIVAPGRRPAGKREGSGARPPISRGASPVDRGPYQGAFAVPPIESPRPLQGVKVTDTIDDARKLIESRLAEIEAEGGRLERALTSLGEGSVTPRRSPRRAAKPGPSATSKPKRGPRKRLAPKRAKRGQRQAELLATIKKMSGASASELADAIGIKPTQVHALIRKAEAERKIKKKGQGFPWSRLDKATQEAEPARLRRQGRDWFVVVLHTGRRRAVNPVAAVDATVGPWHFEPVRDVAAELRQVQLQIVVCDHARFEKQWFEKAWSRTGGTAKA